MFTRRETLLPYGSQSIDDDDVAAVVAQLRDPWLTQGPTVGRFESALCELTGARYAVAVASGTAALHLACLAAGVGAGDVGLTSDNTFVASANAIRYAGGRAFTVDVDPETGLLDLDALEARAEALARAGAPPKVLIPVDFAGSIADLPRVRALADRLGAKVIEDAAHSLGSTYAHAGETFRAASCAHTDMAILSFHPVKHLTTGEGGAITTNDEGTYKLLLELRTHGITRDPAKLTLRDEGPWYYEQHALGYHYRITDMQCALGISQAKRFPGFLARRRALAARYDAAFARSPWPERLRPLRVPAGVTSAYHLYVVSLVTPAGEALDGVAARRKALFTALRERNIGPQVHYIPVHRQPDFVRAGLSEGTFERMERYYAGCLSLPLFPAMSDADADYVVDALADALSSGQNVSP